MAITRRSQVAENATPGEAGRRIAKKGMTTNASQAENDSGVSKNKREVPNDTTVYLRTNNSRDSDVLHLDPDCSRLHHQPREVTRGHYAHLRLCMFCTGQIDRVRHTGTQLSTRLEHADSLEELREGSA